MSIKAFRAAVEQVLATFEENGQDYLTYLQAGHTHGDEAMVRGKIVEPLLDALGYDRHTELHWEERAGTGYADLYVEAIGPDPADEHATMRLEGVPAMVVELKRTGLRGDDFVAQEEQLAPYVLLKGVRYGVLTNGHDVRVYERAGDTIRLAFAFSLTPFAPDATTPPSDDARMALAGFYDLLNRDSFLDVERYKLDIVTPPHHQLQLTADQPQNEEKLIGELTREIHQLHRLVLLRFRAHCRRMEQFETERRERQAGVETARTRLVEWVQAFTDRVRLASTAGELSTFLDTFEEHWHTFESEDTFVERVLDVSDVGRHLNGADRITFTNRARDVYRAFTQYRRWHLRQGAALRLSRRLVEDFEQWQEEIGIMAEAPEAEFCLQTVYIFVTRLLLIRICEDKDIVTEKISNGGYEKYLNFSNDFYRFVGHANRRLLSLAYEDAGYIYGHFFSQTVFDWYDWPEESVVRLFYVLNPYSFAGVSADLIGRIYEQYVDELERKRKGQFYTPAPVVRAVLDAAAYEGPQIVGTKLLDPACGSGRFLVEAARRLIPHLEAAYRQTATLDQPVDYEDLVNNRLRNSLFGMDVNRFACFLAEVNLVVQALDLFRKADEPFTILRFHVYPTNSLLPSERGGGMMAAPVRSGLPAEDSLAGEALVADLIKRRGRHPTDPALDFRHGFDYVVGNPPYVRADTPGVAAMRRRIENTGRYPSLYKKWDLYIPFIDLSLNLLKDGGHHAFIVSDAYQTEEYARQSRTRLLEETIIEQIVFAPDVHFFEEAAVSTVIYGVCKRGPTEDHKTERRLVLRMPMDDPHNRRDLKALSQVKWGEDIFRSQFKGDEGLDFSECIPLGELCYINSGLELQSHEKFDPIVDGRRQKLFVKDDLVVPHKDKIHPKPYVEGEDIGDLVILRFNYLEWGTDRVPSKLRRSRFPELFENEKIMMGETSGLYYDAVGAFVNNHSVRNFVPYHAYDDADVRRTVAGLLAREITDEDVAALELTPAELERSSKTDLAERVIAQRAERSRDYNLRYLTALLNCTWLRDYVMTFIRRGSRRRLYPNDLKAWPIAPADAKTQQRVAQLVREIVDAKEDLQRLRDDGHDVDAGGVTLNPKPFLARWDDIPSGDLVDAAGIVHAEIGGQPTTVEEDGDRVIFRKVPLSYLESPHAPVRTYLRRYLEANYEALRAVPERRLAQEIRLPRTVDGVEAFLRRLEREEFRATLRVMDAAQREALIDELAFDIYGVDDEVRQELSGRFYTFDDVPDETRYVSVLIHEDESPLTRVAFPWNDGWTIRTDEDLPDAVLLWVSDGKTVDASQWVIL